MIDRGRSVLFDAAALLTPVEVMDDLVAKAAARDFVADAFQQLPGEDGLASFIAELGKLRVWGREPSVKLGKASPPVK